MTYYAACCQTDQPNPCDREQMADNTTRIIEQLEQAVIGYRPFHDVKLVVFPEFAHAAPIYQSAEELSEKLAVEFPNRHTDRLADAARKHGVWIQSGSFLEVDPRWTDALFNSTVLISPEGEIISRYRKVNPWIPWEVHTSPHDIEGYDEELFPVTETEIGKLGVATCYDWLFPETCRELTLGGAEVLIRISAYMDPWGASEPMDWWTVINRCRAIENLAAVVACNQGASASHYPPFSWPGASMVIDPDGRILAQAPTGPGQATVVAPVSLDNIRKQRRRRSGHAMPAHLRSSAYPLQRQEIFPPQSFPPQSSPPQSSPPQSSPPQSSPPQSSHRSPSIESLEQSIEEAKKRIGW